MSTAILTVVTTAWKRPASLRRVLDVLFRQTIPLEVFLWDNGEQEIDDSRIAWRVHSSPNRQCWPRWFLAAQADTPLVANIDDDLLLTDDRVLEDAVDVLETLEPRAIVGPYGRRIVDGVRFLDCPHVDPGTRDERVDLIKGRLMVMRTQSLRAVLPCRPDAPPDLLGQCDDIIVSSLMAGGRRGCHVVPAVLRGRMTDLPQEHGLCLQAGFYDLRGRAARRFFPEDASK